MNKIRFIFTGFFALLFVSFFVEAKVQENLIEMELEKARTEFRLEKEEYEKSVLKHLDKLEEEARKVGNKKQVDLVKINRSDFLKTKQTSPSFVGVSKLKLNQSQASLVLAYKKAIAEYTKIKKDKEAEDVEKELENFKLQGDFLEKKNKDEIVKLKDVPKVRKFDLGLNVSLEMVLIPPGKFLMGSPIAEFGRGENENQHLVYITKSFYMAKFEVTQAQWEAVTGYNPSFFKGSKLPVSNISWMDCQDFVRKLNFKTKGKFRMPTEAEWEYCCRAGTETVFSFGDNLSSDNANYAESKKAKPLEVGSYKPNNFGIYDMHGNVWEWVNDWLGDYPKIQVSDPTGLQIGKSKILRGGCYEYSASAMRSANRGFNFPDNRHMTNGFRLAASQ